MLDRFIRFLRTPRHIDTYWNLVLDRHRQERRGSILKSESVAGIVRVI